MGQIIPLDRSLTELTTLYDRLINLKRQYLLDLEFQEKTSDVKTASDGLSRVQQRIQNIKWENLPMDIPPKVIKTAISKLDSQKESRDVEKLLRVYNDGAKSQLPDSQFLAEFLTAVDILNLIELPKAKRASLKLTINALLVKY